MRLVLALRAVAAAVLVVSLAVVVVLASDGGGLTRRPSGTGPPWGLSGAPGVYDPSDGCDLWLLTGGLTWTYSNGTWSNLTATAGILPAMSLDSRMAYDARDGYVLLFGGAVSTPALSPISETWEFHAGRWTNLTSTVGAAPPAGALGFMTYDSEDAEVLLAEAAPLTAPPSLPQTWTYSGGHWANATVAGGPQIPGGFTQPPWLGASDDPRDGYVLVYNSLPGLRSGEPETWAYRAGSWTNLTAGAAPSPYLIYFNAFLLDSTIDTVVVQSACISTAGYSCAHQDATFEYESGRWTDVTPSVVPGVRLGPSFADDPSDGGVMVVGGCCWIDLSGLSLPWQDVWVFSGGVWHESTPWSGALPTWAENVGVWIGLAIVAAVVVVGSTAGRRSRASGPPP